jgi:competence protein ComEC
MWQLHFSFTGGKERNASDPFIANLEEHDEGMYLKVSASEDGSFTVFNQRNKYTKAYRAK